MHAVHEQSERNRSADSVIGAFSGRIASLAGLSCALVVGLWALQYVSSDIAETRGQEPLIITGVMKILAGGELYTHPSSTPFDLMQYTPIYYYLAAYTAKAAGCVAGDAEGVTRVGRLLSFGFAVAHLVALSFICLSVLRIRFGLAVLAAAMV